MLKLSGVSPKYPLEPVKESSKSGYVEMENVLPYRNTRQIAEDGDLTRVHVQESTSVLRVMNRMKIPRSTATNVYRFSKTENQ